MDSWTARSGDRVNVVRDFQNSVGPDLDLAWSQIICRVGISGPVPESGPIQDFSWSAGLVFAFLSSFRTTIKLENPPFLVRCSIFSDRDPEID